MKDVRVFIVSAHFPPSTVAGVHRARHLAKHLPSFGWEPTIFSVAPKYHVETLDYELETLLPEHHSRVECEALPARVTKYLGVYGDIGIRGLPFLANALLQHSRKAKPDLVMITGSPFYPMLLSSWIRKKLGVPVLLDFQDPWVSAEGAKHSFPSKRWLSHRLARFLEPIALKSASFVTSVSERQNRDMLARYSWLRPENFAALPIGGDPDDFASVRSAKSQTKKGETFDFYYVGTALPRSTPLLSLLFQAIGEMLSEKPDLQSRLRLNFVGTSNQPGQGGKPRVLPIADQAGISHVISERPGRVPFLEALRLLSNADAVLMIGSDEPHYTASKIYPGMMCGRPHFSFFHPESSAFEILKSAGGGVTIAYQSGELAEKCKAEIKSGLLRIIGGSNQFGVIQESAYYNYTARRISSEYANIFDRIGK